MRSVVPVALHSCAATCAGRATERLSLPLCRFHPSYKHHLRICFLLWAIFLSLKSGFFHFIKPQRYKIHPAVIIQTLKNIGKGALGRRPFIHRTHTICASHCLDISFLIPESHAQVFLFSIANFSHIFISILAFCVFLFCRFFPFGNYFFHSPPKSLNDH